MRYLQAAPYIRPSSRPDSEEGHSNWLESSKKGELLDQTRERVHASGYMYKRHKSQSKMLRNEPEPKHVKTNKSARKIS